MRKFLLFTVLLALSACNEDDQATVAPVRGLKTHLVADAKKSTIRRFPAVLEPTSLNTLSFEVAGKLDAVPLAVGQRVQVGQTLLSLDTTSSQLQLDTAEAGIPSAQVARDNAVDNLARQTQLLERGVTTQKSLDEARTQSAAAQAQLEQATKTRDSARETLSKTTIISPIDGIINSVDAVSYGTVLAGAPMVSLYSPDQFEISFSVNFDTVSQLVVGTPATVRLADLPDVNLDAVVSELGSRADAVSSFPVVLKLKDTDPVLKAGMAVEATIELPLPAQKGFTLPLSAIVKKGQIGFQADGLQGQSAARVFVFDPQTENVFLREVTVGGVRENELLVIDGLEYGELVAAAGVSFLRNGMQVKLLDGE
jgi:RND family efflux transporter MFP subunit